MDKKKKLKKERSADDHIRIKKEESSLAEFTQRSLPTEEQASQFEEYIEEESKDGDSEESLSEIYQDENGGMVDVKKLDRKKRKGIVFWFFYFVFMTGVLSAIGYFAYNYYYL